MVNLEKSCGYSKNQIPRLQPTQSRNDSFKEWLLRFEMDTSKTKVCHSEERAL